jgi:hypothetical protein
VKHLLKYVSLAAILGVVAFGCSQDNDTLQIPSAGTRGGLESALDGTEILGDIAIPLEPGTGIVVGGIGTRTVQPGAITVNVPGTVKQVILYWEGNNPTAVGDNQVTVEGNTVTGTLIGGPTYFYTNAYTTTYRADITSLGVVTGGANSIEVSGMDYAKNNGAGVVVIYDDGSAPSQIGIKDGNDCAYYLFAPTLDTTVPQTFTFAAATIARQATLAVLASGVDPNLPNVIRVTVNGVVTDLVDPLLSSGGAKFDAYMTTVNIPAGVTEMTVQCLSLKDPTSILTGQPASLIWNCAALSVPSETEQPVSLGDYVWFDANHDGIQNAEEDGIQGVPVKLYACGGTTPLAMTTTDANGYYHFTNLVPGDYYVEFALLANHVFSPKDQGLDNALDSDADVATGKTVCTTLSAGEDDMTWDAGMYERELGGEACGPGYWKNTRMHYCEWEAAGYATTDDFDTVFGTNYFNPDRTLLVALQSGGGGYNALGRHAVAALLSAAHPDVNYGLTVEDVINAVRTGDKGLLDGYDEMGCPLNNCKGHF